MNLEGTVVVGYGVQKKINLTGAISSVTSETLENRVAPTLTHMLQGSVPGLNVTTSSGRPGNTASINIRGINSINGGSPLVLVDGVDPVAVLMRLADISARGKDARLGVQLAQSVVRHQHGDPVAALGEGGLKAEVGVIHRVPPLSWSASRIGRLPLM